MKTSNTVEEVIMCIVKHDQYGASYSPCIDNLHILAGAYDMLLAYNQSICPVAQRRNTVRLAPTSGFWAGHDVEACDYYDFLALDKDVPDERMERYAAGSMSAEQIKTAATDAYNEWINRNGHTEM